MAKKINKSGMLLASAVAGLLAMAGGAGTAVADSH